MKQRRQQALQQKDQLSAFIVHTRKDAVSRHFLQIISKSFCMLQPHLPTQFVYCNVLSVASYCPSSTQRPWRYPVLLLNLQKLQHSIKSSSKGTSRTGIKCLCWFHLPEDCRNKRNCFRFVAGRILCFRAPTPALRISNLQKQGLALAEKITSGVKRSSRAARSTSPILLML